MYIEDLKYAMSDIGADRFDEVFIEVYAKGHCFLVPLTYSRLSTRVGVNGDKIVVIDSTDN